MGRKRGRGRKGIWREEEQRKEGYEGRREWGWVQKRSFLSPFTCVFIFLEISSILFDDTSTAHLFLELPAEERLQRELPALPAGRHSVMINYLIQARIWHGSRKKGSIKLWGDQDRRNCLCQAPGDEFRLPCQGRICAQGTSSGQGMWGGREGGHESQDGRKRLAA